MSIAPESALDVASTVLGNADLVTEILNWLPVRMRASLALVSQDVLAAVSRRHTYQNRVPGCSLELYYGGMVETKVLTAGVPTILAQGAKGNEPHVTYMDKKALIETLLAFQYPQISIVTPVSYGKSLMAVIVAMSYVGGKRRPSGKLQWYRIGDNVAPLSRVVVAAPHKCIGSLLNQFEAAYPGSVNWNRPSMSPVVVWCPRMGRKEACMHAYCDRILLQESKYTPGSTSTRYTFSPMNKVLVISHGAFHKIKAAIGALHQPRLVLDDVVDSSLLIVDESHVICNMVRNTLDGRPVGARAVTFSATTHIPTASKMYTTKMVDSSNVDALDRIQLITVTPTALQDETPHHTVEPALLASDATHYTLLYLATLQYSRIVYVVPDRLDIEVTDLYYYMDAAGYNVVINRGSDGVRPYTPTDSNPTPNETNRRAWRRRFLDDVVALQADHATHAIEQQADGCLPIPADGIYPTDALGVRLEIMRVSSNGNIRKMTDQLVAFNRIARLPTKVIMVVKSSAIAMGVSIDAEFVVIKGHASLPARNPRYNVVDDHGDVVLGPGEPGVERDYTPDEKQSITHMVPLTLYQLAGRFVRANHKGIDSGRDGIELAIPKVKIMLTYYGKDMTAPDARVVLKVILMLYRLKHEGGVVTPLNHPYRRAGRLLRTMGEAWVNDLSDLTLLYHMFPSSKALEPHYAGIIPCQLYTAKLLRLYRVAILTDEDVNTLRDELLTLLVTRDGVIEHRDDAMAIDPSIVDGADEGPVESNWHHTRPIPVSMTINSALAQYNQSRRESATVSPSEGGSDDVLYGGIHDTPSPYPRDEYHVGVVLPLGPQPPRVPDLSIIIPGTLDEDEDDEPPTKRRKIDYGELYRQPAELERPEWAPEWWPDGPCYAPYDEIAWY